MEQVLQSHYLGYVLLIAVVITGDAFVSTLGQFHNEKLTYLNWAGFLALTHSAFPATSFIFFSAIASYSEWASLGVSLTGVILISLVVYEMLCDAFDTEPTYSLSGRIEKMFGLCKYKAKHFTKVLAVSWDAFTIGPLLVLEASDQQWNTPMIVMMFIIFAIVVGFSLSLTLYACGQLREKHFSGTEKLTKLNFYGSFFEVSVVSSFAVALLLEVFAVKSNLLVSLIISTTIFTTVYAANKSTLWAKAKRDAEEAVAE